MCGFNSRNQQVHSTTLHLIQQFELLFFTLHTESGKDIFGLVQKPTPTLKPTQPPIQCTPGMPKLGNAPLSTAKIKIKNE